MQKKLVIILPIIAFSVIFIHALYGHLIFGFSTSTGQEINKHSTYIHLQPEWDSYPTNILFDVTTVWSTQVSNDPEAYYDEELDVQLKSNYNPNELQYINNKSFVKLNHEFNDCKIVWKPIAYRHTFDTLHHFFENLQGVQENSDPYVVIYSPLPNRGYELEEQNFKLKSGFSQFIPICTLKETTSYDFSVKINEENLGFDVFFIPSMEQQEIYHQNIEEFNFYAKKGCYGNNFQRFSGTCENVSKESGLLIILPDELRNSITEISVYLHEKA